MRAIRDIAQQVQIRHGARLPDGMVPDPIAFAEEVAAIVLAESILDRRLESYSVCKEWVCVRCNLSTDPNTCRTDPNEGIVCISCCAKEKDPQAWIRRLNGENFTQPTVDMIETEQR